MSLPSAPPTPVPAASILLLRDGRGGLEVLMQQRRDESSAFAGVLAFPGGKVHAADYGAGPGADREGDRDDPAAAARMAALRETFEECGILLAAAAAAARDALIPMRERIERDPGLWRTALAERGVALAADALVPWAHWVTPAFAPKRFDTRFFAAAAPADQAPLAGREAASYLWARPAEILVEAEAGRRLVVFVTRMNLLRLAQYADVAAALAAARLGPVAPIHPRKIETPEGAFMQIPDEAPYPVKRLPFATASTEIDKRRRGGA
jgi:8-oxo-dGTP pyrophosphatase MutT (NUDIX family)